MLGSAARVSAISTTGAVFRQEPLKKVVRATKNETIPTITLGKCVERNRPDISTDVLTIESVADYQRLTKLLAALPRPFAVAVARVR